MIIEIADQSVGPMVCRMVESAHEVRTLFFSGRGFVTVSGDERYIDRKLLEATPGVVRVVDTTRNQFFLASRECKPDDTLIEVAGVVFGGSQVVVIAGPCAVENLEDTLETAMALKSVGISLLRGGAFKPRTTPYNFQGLGCAGLEILAEVRRRTGMGVVSEVMSPEDVETAARCVDILQVGTFNMTNTPLLKRLGGADKPVLLKRGSSSTIAELLKAAEFIIYNGNPRVILCERGIKTHETATRNTLDLSAVPVLKRLSHLPVVVDPSHATGQSALVPVMSKCALVAGADGLLIESHVRPETMIKPGDAAQSLLPTEVGNLLKELRMLGQIVGRQV